MTDEGMIQFAFEEDIQKEFPFYSKILLKQDGDGKYLSDWVDERFTGWKNAVQWMNTFKD